MRREAEVSFERRQHTKPRSKPNFKKYFGNEKAHGTDHERNDKQMAGIAQLPLWQ